MPTQIMAFSLPSYRALKMFIGELTATAAATEVAVGHTIGVLASRDEADPWRGLGRTFGIRLDGVRSQVVARGASRLHLVSAYSAFDAFLRGLRSDWQRIAKKEWKHASGDSPFDEIFANWPMETSEMKVLISEGHRAALDYYRKCRTAVVHPTEETRAEAESCFEQNALALAQLREAYGEYRMPGAPNAFDQLTFQDVKMLARLVLEIARIISSAFDPGDDQIATTVPIRNWARLSHDRERLRQRVAGYLRTTFGLDVARADRIADIAVGSLA